METTAGSSHNRLSHQEFRYRAFLVAKIAVLLMVAAVVFYKASTVILVVFAGILLSAVLGGASEWVEEHTPLSYGWSLTAVLAGLVVTFGTFAWVAVPNITEQYNQLTDQLPKSLSALRATLGQYAWGAWVLDAIKPESMLEGARNMMSSATGALRNVMYAAGSLVVILFLGIYGAAESGRYRRGFLHLVPPERRARVDKVLHEVASTLRWWMLGRLLSMTLVGVLVAVGLYFLEIPLALILGVIAGVLDFVPNFGPIIAALPGVLLALTIGWQEALLVTALYATIQILEGYLITPLIQRQTVLLPPALLISMQVIMGVIFGFVGLALATPLTAAGLVLVKRLYVEDALGDSLQEDTHPA